MSQCYKWSDASSRVTHLSRIMLCRSSEQYDAHPDALTLRETDANPTNIVLESCTISYLPPSIPVHVLRFASTSWWVRFNCLASRARWRQAAVRMCLNQPTEEKPRSAKWASLGGGSYLFNNTSSDLPSTTRSGGHSVE